MYYLVFVGILLYLIEAMYFIIFICIYMYLYVHNVFECIMWF